MQGYSNLKVDSIDEAMEAARWLKGSRPYMFDREHQSFGTFDGYLDWLRLLFEDRLFIDGEETDAGGLAQEAFSVLHLHRLRWEQRDRLSNVALMVHELAEGYMITNDFAFWPSYCHVVAEYFEGDFRVEKSLPLCPVSPLPQDLIPLMRQFEVDLRQHFPSMQHRGIERLIESYPIVNRFVWDRVRVK